MNKKDLASKVAVVLGITKKDALAVIDTTFDVLAQSIIDGETVNISKFAKFSTKDTTARTLKNIKTGEMMEVPASVRPVVKFSEAFKDAVKTTRA